MTDLKFYSKKHAFSLFFMDAWIELVNFGVSLFCTMDLQRNSDKAYLYLPYIIVFGKGRSFEDLDPIPATTAFSGVLICNFLSKTKKST